MPTDQKAPLGTFPVVALRGLVAFPDMVLTLDVGRKKSIKALQSAMDRSQPIYLVTQKDITVENPNIDDLYKIGCLCRVRQVLKTPDGNVKVLVQGLYRATHKTFADNGAYYVSMIERCEDKPDRHRAVYKEGLLRRIRSEFERYAAVNPNLPADVVMAVATDEDIMHLCDYIAFHIPAPFDDKQFVLEQLSLATRAKVLLELLSKEREVT
ncbi:MAG: LON peptidase substrate-binding domain-containing protein, partial [Clostridia bacterium]|nr:LON peptidase substrate-binding domain-containing protein [Clostridia bacterium]